MIIDHENHRIIFRQSWFGDYLICPERARRYIVEPEARQGTDATILGTAMHSYAETRLDGEDIEVAMGAAFNALDNEFALPHRIVQMRDAEAVYTFLPAVCASWERDILPQVKGGGESERKFSIRLFDWRGWEIWLEGTIDYLEPMINDALWDWKTAGQEYKKWEKERWAVQPTFYAIAAVELGLRAWPVRWKYGVVTKSPVARPKTQVVEFTRNEGHKAWLVRQLTSLLEQHGLDLALQDNCGGTLGTAWLMNDQHALCSEKWCPFWSSCKGANVTFN